MAKTEIHPNYQPSTITCACGATFEPFSTPGSCIDRFRRKYGRNTPGAKPVEAAPAEKTEKAE